MFKVYTKRNNELVEKFQIYSTCYGEARRSISNLLTDLWKCLVKHPYHDTNVPLIVTCCCNVILSQLLLDHTQVDQNMVLAVTHETLKKIVWWETSTYNPKLDSSHVVSSKITSMLEKVINREDTFLQVGPPLLYLCSLIYLISHNESVLEIIRKVIKKKMTLMNFCVTKDTALYIPFFNSDIARSLEEIVESVVDVADLVSAMGSSRDNEHQPKSIKKEESSSRNFALLKSIQIRGHLNGPKQSSLLDEFLRSSRQSSLFSCLSSSIIASHLSTSHKPALVAKILSLSLREVQDSLPLVQASSAINLVDQLDIANGHHLQQDVLRLAERELRHCGMPEDRTQSEVSLSLLSLFQLFTVPPPSWAQLKLARVILLEKRYDDALPEYNKLLNSPLWSKAEEKKVSKISDIAIFLHEYALTLLLSNKLRKLEQFIAKLQYPDFVMLIIQTELFLKQKTFESAIKALNRAIIELECSPTDSSIKEPILDLCHSKLEYLVTRRPQDDKWEIMSSSLNPSECPSCGGSLTSTDFKDSYHLSQDLAICHLFHEV